MLIQGQAPQLAQLQALPPFAPQHCTLSNVHKTGLGSSAAMTTSLTAGVLLHLGIAKGESEDGAMPLASLGLIHNTAQLAHCAAQGKVGSGFDVSSSVWGNQLYRRFDPSLIKDVMREESGFRIVRTPTETEKVRRSTDAAAADPPAPGARSPQPTVAAGAAGRQRRADRRRGHDGNRPCVDARERRAPGAASATPWHPHVPRGRRCGLQHAHTGRPSERVPQEQARVGYVSRLTQPPSSTA